MDTMVTDKLAASAMAVDDYATSPRSGMSPSGEEARADAAGGCALRVLPFNALIVVYCSENRRKLELKLEKTLMRIKTTLAAVAIVILSVSAAFAATSSEVSEQVVGQENVATSQVMQDGTTTLAHKIFFQLIDKDKMSGLTEKEKMDRFCKGIAVMLASPDHDDQMTAFYLCQKFLLKGSHHMWNQVLEGLFFQDSSGAKQLRPLTAGRMQLLAFRATMNELLCFEGTMDEQLGDSYKKFNLNWIYNTMFGSPLVGPQIMASLGMRGSDSTAVSAFTLLFASGNRASIPDRLAKRVFAIMSGKDAAMFLRFFGVNREDAGDLVLLSEATKVDFPLLFPIIRMSPTGRLVWEEYIRRRDYYRARSTLKTLPTDGIMLYDMIAHLDVSLAKKWKGDPIPADWVLFQDALRRGDATDATRYSQKLNDGLISERQRVQLFTLRKDQYLNTLLAGNLKGALQLYPQLYKERIVDGSDLAKWLVLQQNRLSCEKIGRLVAQIKPMMRDGDKLTDTLLQAERWVKANQAAAKQHARAKKTAKQQKELEKLF